MALLFLVANGFPRGACGVQVSGSQQKSHRGITPPVAVKVLQVCKLAYEKSSLIIPPSRTRVIGLPVLVSYSIVGSIPRLW